MSVLTGMKIPIAILQRIIINCRLLLYPMQELLLDLSLPHGLNILQLYIQCTFSQRVHKYLWIAVLNCSCTANWTELRLGYMHAESLERKAEPGLCCIPEPCTYMLFIDLGTRLDSPWTETGVSAQLFFSQSRTAEQGSWLGQTNGITQPVRGV